MASKSGLPTFTDGRRCAGSTIIRPERQARGRGRRTIADNRCPMTEAADIIGAGQSHGN